MGSETPLGTISDGDREVLDKLSRSCFMLIFRDVDSRLGLRE